MIQHFGSTFRETFAALKGVHLEADPAPARTAEVERMHAIARIWITSFLLVAGITSAFGFMGVEYQCYGRSLVTLVAGYWAK